jgi:hypothetical protein
MNFTIEQFRALRRSRICKTVVGGLCRGFQEGLEQHLSPTRCEAIIGLQRIPIAECPGLRNSASLNDVNWGAMPQSKRSSTLVRCLGTPRITVRPVSQGRVLQAQGERT